MLRSTAEVFMIQNITVFFIIYNLQKGTEGEIMDCLRNNTGFTECIF
jgi:hypothetical protein